MNVFDIIVGLVLAFFLLRGFRKGFWHEAFGLGGVVGGLIAGILGATPLARWIQELIPGFPRVTLLILCFTLLFSVVYYLAVKAAESLKKLSENFSLGWLNSFVGGIFGVAKGAFIISLVLMYISFFPLQKKVARMEKDSFLHKPVFYLAPSLYKWLGSLDELPDEVRDVLKKGREEMLEDALKDVKKELEDAFEDQKPLR
ncbi:MAG: hypothetical protein D6681_04320 [Calditrichaeota bacterium]|nr:MAG: hypothetical protein D6681_04320 [Calditrichota bacterium]